MKAARKTEKAIKNTIHGAFEAYKNRDEEAFRRLIAPDPDVVMYGTGMDEKRVGWNQIRAQLRRDWSQSDSAELHLDSLSVSASGTGACAAGDGSIKITVDGQQRSMPIRFTASLENRSNHWVFVQMHFSTPAMLQNGGQSF